MKFAAQMAITVCAAFFSFSLPKTVLEWNRIFDTASIKQSNIADILNFTVLTDTQLHNTNIAASSMNFVIWYNTVCKRSNYERKKKQERDGAAF